MKQALLPCAVRGSSTLPALLLVLASAAIGPAHAQVQEQWSTDLGTPLGHTARVVVDSTGHTVTCSGTHLTGLQNTGVHLYQVYRLDPAGTVVWMREYRPPGGFNERAFWITVDSADNVIVTGHRRPAQGLLNDSVTIKYSPAGDLLWEHHGGGANFGSTAVRVEVDAADNVYVFGSGDGLNDLMQVTKIDPSGNTVWVRGFTPALGVPVSLRSLAVAPDGRVVITGGVSNSAFVTRSYDTVGNLLWSADYGAGVGGARDVVIDGTGATYVCGAAAAPSGLAGVVLKYSPAGALEWEAFHNGPNGPFDAYNRLAVDPAGNVVAVGYTASSSIYVDWSTIKLSPAGVLEWSRVYGGVASNDESATMLQIDAAGSVYVLGTAKPAPTFCDPFTSDVDATVVKYDSAGNQVWVLHAECTGAPTSLDLDASQGAVVFNTPAAVTRWSIVGPPSNFCTAIANSTGLPCSLGFIGTSSLTAGDLVLDIQGTLPASQFGYFLTSRNQQFVPNPGGSAGNLCLGPEIGRRVGGVVFNSGLAGSASVAVDPTVLPQSSGGPVAAQAGETWYFQAWYRDLIGGVATSNFSDGLAVTWY